MPAVDRSGGVLGVAPPIPFSGSEVGPHYMVNTTSNLLTTATRLYYTPIFLHHIKAWAGIKTYNSGAGDNGEVYRVGIYEEAAAGGPGTLLKDCGEVTLTGASAIRSSANSFANTKIGWHYLAVHFNDATNMWAMQGATNNDPYGSQSIPVIGAMADLGGTATPGRVVSYVDTAYGALASTAVTPTGTTTLAPLARLYV